MNCRLPMPKADQEVVTARHFLDDYLRVAWGDSGIFCYLFPLPPSLTEDPGFTYIHICKCCHAAGGKQRDR